MLGNIFGQSGFADLSVLAAITTTLVQLIKQIIPKQIPTKIVTLVVGILVTLFFTLKDQTITFSAGIQGILMGCLTAFVSMNGFDALRDIWQRFVNDDNGDVNG